jgi:hypothetical protein
MTNHSPIDPNFPSLFHRLAPMGEHLEHCISTDLDNYQDWIGTLKMKMDQKLTKLATADLEEKWWEWKADQIDHRAAAELAIIDFAVRDRNSAYFITAANSLGLACMAQGPRENPVLPP